MIVFSALFMVGSALSISAQNWQWFTGAGVVTKFALGIAQTTLIVYIAEIAPFQLRGTGMAAYQLFLAGGQLIGAIATQIQIKTDPTVWRPLMASEFVMTGVSQHGRRPGMRGNESDLRHHAALRPRVANLPHPTRK
jgi:MFS family permease